MSKSISRRSEVALWVLQALLATLFLFAGVSKMAMPPVALAAMSPLPVAFLKAIGGLETLGALGLVLPGVFRVRRELTPLAATGLAVVMAGAVTCTVVLQGVEPAIFPLVVGILAVSVARGRASWRRTRRTYDTTVRTLAPAGR